MINLKIGELYTTDADFYFGDYNYKNYDAYVNKRNEKFLILSYCYFEKFLDDKIQITVLLKNKVIGKRNFSIDLLKHFKEIKK